MSFSPPSAATLVITGIGYECSPVASGYAIDPTPDCAAGSHLTTSRARR